MTAATKCAYLRELEGTKCELTFDLNEQEIRVARPIEANVKSLLQNIEAEVRMAQKTKKKITPVLKDGSTEKHINLEMDLRNLIDTVMRINFQILNQTYFVAVNAPLVQEIKLPAVLYAHFSLEPSQLRVLFTDDCLYTWFKSKDRVTWDRVANTRKYATTDDDLDYFLKLDCVPCNTVLTGPSVEVVSEEKVRRVGDLVKCPFEERHKLITKKLENNSFRLISYNILSKRYTTNREEYPHCSPETLSADYRKQLIVKELLGYRADIFCLQEVDASLYDTYYKEKIENDGYISFFHRKGDKSTEGLACFFKTTLFEKVDDHQIIYSNKITEKTFAKLLKILKANPELEKCFMQQPTSLHVTVLKLKTLKRNHYIIIGNTHLFYHPDAGLVRVLQSSIATAYLHELRKQYLDSGDRVDVIFCGDFNSAPTSAVYHFMVEQRLKQTHEIFQKCNNKPDLFHNFQFKSACGTPQYTNYTDDFKGCLDYIFIEKNKMKVKKVVALPSEEELIKRGGLPNDVYPSDHLALVAELEII